MWSETPPRFADKCGKRLRNIETAIRRSYTVILKLLHELEDNEINIWGNFVLPSTGNSTLKFVTNSMLIPHGWVSYILQVDSKLSKELYPSGRSVRVRNRDYFIYTIIAQHALSHSEC